MKILVTAFDPFGGEKVNTALEATNIVSEKIMNVTIVKQEVPTVFGKSFEVVKSAIKKHAPDFVICVGQAGGSDNISVERIAINIDDARIEDNEGNQPKDTSIVDGGETALFSTLPVKSIIERINNSGLKATISNSAGTFVCNHLMYSVLNFLQQFNVEGSTQIRAGFIHVPFIKEDSPNCEKLVQEIARALEIAIEVCILETIEN